MRTIKLYGHLGKEFGKLHKLDVKTPAEAIRALKANFPEFTKSVVEHNTPGYMIVIGNENRSDPEMLQYPADNDIKIVPVVQGSGGQWGTVIVGAVLIAAAIAVPALAGAYIGTMSGVSAGVITAAEAATASTIMSVAGMASTAMMAVGTSLVLSGVSSLLFSPSKVSPTTSGNPVDQISSSHFNGPVNLSQQGNPIPIAYGQVLVGSQVISAGITTSKV